MSNANSTSAHVAHKDKHVAFHVEWNFRNEGVVWHEGLPVRPNFHPLASELRAWMLQQGRLWFFAKKDEKIAGAYTNPYTNDGSLLSITYARS